MYSLSVSKQEALELAQHYFKQGNFHPSYMESRKRIIRDKAIYDGSGQWREKDIDALAEIGQLPLTVNVTQGFINAVSGIELQTRHRIACRTPDEEDDDLALAMTHLLFNFQTQEKVPFKGTRKFRDAMVCGISWSNIYNENNRQYYEHVNPINMVPDSDDLSPQYEEMKYVCRKRWMWPDRVLKIWPKAKDMIDFSSPNLVDGLYSPEIDDRSSSFTSLNNSSANNQTKVMVVESQYKIPKKAYSGIDKNGNYFETFDEDRAEDFLDPSNKITEVDSHRIMRTLFLDNCLLEHSPLNPDLPSLDDFTYIPFVWNREDRTGICYGVVNDVKDIQYDLNVRLTKSIHLINSSKTTIEGPLPPGMNQETIRKEVKRRDGVLMVPLGTKIQVESNAPLGEEQFKIIDQHLKLMQRVTGVNDEMLGIETNASSAVSQNVRQMSSMRKNMFAFDNFTYMKLREGKFILSLIQGLGLENMYVKMLNEEDQRSFILNLTKEYNGEKYIFNDVRTLPFDLYIEEIPDYQSSFEEQRENLQALLGNANAAMILQSPYMLKMMGFRDAEKVASEIRNAMQERAMMEQGLQPQPSQGPAGVLPPQGAGMDPASLLQLQ
jgi:hypothetical protein